MRKLLPLLVSLTVTLAPCWRRPRVATSGRLRRACDAAA